MKNSIIDRFGTRDRAEKFVTALSGGCDLVIGACHTLAIVAKSWDGKKYNKRFTDAVNNALRERFGSVYPRPDFECNAVKLYLDRRSFHRDGDELHFSWVLARRDVFLDESGCTTTYFDKEIYGDVYVQLDEDGRIDAKHFETNARVAADRVLQTQVRYEDAIKFWDKYVEILDDIDEFIWNRVQGVNGLFVRGGMQYFNTASTPNRDAKWL